MKKVLLALALIGATVIESKAQDVLGMTIKDARTYLKKTTFLMGETLGRIKDGDSTFNASISGYTLKCYIDIYTHTIYKMYVLPEDNSSIRKFANYLNAAAIGMQDYEWLTIDPFGKVKYKYLSQYGKYGFEMTED